MCKKTISGTIKEWVVNDYFTPNIKAEVILDTLLTPYVAQIVERKLGKQDGELTFLTKEMSIPASDTFGSSAPKIDYVLASRETVYLVELKTTDSSINDLQTANYLNNCPGKPFGERLGRQLLFILDKPDDTFTLHLLDDSDKWGAPSQWDDETLKNVFQAIISKSFHVPAGAAGNSCAEKARELIRSNNWTQRGKYRSRKYLYTLGQLIDYLNIDKSGLWKKPMEVIYLTPYGVDIAAEGKACTSISLRKAVGELQPKPGDEEYVELLQSIIAAIYTAEETPSCHP